MYTQLIAALVPASLVAAVGNSNNVCNKNPYLALRPLSKLPAVQSFCTSKFPAVPCTTTLTTTATATSFTTVSTSTTTTGTTTKTTTVQIDTVQSATSTSTSTVFTGTTTTTTFTSTSTSTTFTTTATVCSTTNDKRDTPDVEPARDGLQYHTLIQRPKLAGRYVPVGRREPARATPCPTPDALKKLAASAVKTFCSCVTKAAPCAAAAATATSTTTSSVTATVSTQATSTTSVTAVTTEFIISTTTISTVTTATTSEVSTTVLSISTVSQVPCLSCTSGTFCDSGFSYTQTCGIRATFVGSGGTPPRVSTQVSVDACRQTCADLDFCNFYTFDLRTAVCTAYDNAVGYASTPDSGSVIGQFIAAC